MSQNNQEFDIFDIFNSPSPTTSNPSPSEQQHQPNDDSLDLFFTQSSNNNTKHQVTLSPSTSPQSSPSNSNRPAPSLPARPTGTKQPSSNQQQQPQQQQQPSTPKAISDEDFFNTFLDHFESKPTSTSPTQTTTTTTSPFTTMSIQTNSAINHTDNDSDFIVIEECENGDLDEFLFSPHLFSNQSSSTTTITTPSQQPHHNYQQTFQPSNQQPILPNRPTRPDKTTTTSSSSSSSTTTTTTNHQIPKNASPTLDMAFDSFLDIDPNNYPPSSPSNSLTPLTPSSKQYNNMKQPSPEELNSSHLTTAPPTNMAPIPCLYTVKQRDGGLYHVDLAQCHDERCGLVDKLTRNPGDECTCGMYNLNTGEIPPSEIEFNQQREKYQQQIKQDNDDGNTSSNNNNNNNPYLIDNDINLYLETPKGSISSTQCTLEQKQIFLQKCQSQSQPNEPSFIKLFSMTFNHYESIPTVQTSYQLFPTNPTDFNIYAFSFQECGSLLKNQALPQQVTTPVLTALNNLSKGSIYSYKLLHCERLLSLFTFVIVRCDIAPYIHKVSSCSVSTGILDLVGNKGAAIIRFFVKNTAVAIVGCHFNAGQSDLLKRNADYHRINAKCNLGMADTMAMRDNTQTKPCTNETGAIISQCFKTNIVINNQNKKLNKNNNNTNNPTDDIDSPSSNLKSNNNDQLIAATQQLQQAINLIKVRYKYNYVFSSPRLTHIASQRLKQAFKYRPSNTIEGKGVYTFTGGTKKEDVFTTPEQLYEFKNDIITRNDVTIWLGDLNYRIGGLQTRDRVFELLSKAQQTTLLTRYEQLLHEKDISGTIFHGFREGSIVFPPSYKYDVGTQIFDSSQKARIPSWTDRILFIDNCSQCFHDLYQMCDCHGISKNGSNPGDCKLSTSLQSPNGTMSSTSPGSNNTNNNGTMHKKTKRTNHIPCQKTLLERYGSIQTVTMSDHKPVFAHFYININEGK